MMPSTNSTWLPPELVDMIIQHLAGDKSTLRSCALVSRAWSVFSQCALFRNAQANLDTYKKMARLLNDLISVPHLQTLIRSLRIQQRWYYDAIPLPAHMSCLTSMLSLLPNLMKVELRNGLGELIETRPYLDSILGNTSLVELDIDIYSVKNFHHVFAILGGTNVKRVSLLGSVDHHEVDLGAPCKRLHLPSLEGIRFGVQGLEEEFHNCIMHNFDLPSLKQCKIVLETVTGLLHWKDVLLRGFLPLELFKLELGCSFIDDLNWTDIPEEDTYHPLPLAGLPFQHVHLSIRSGDLDYTRKFIEWWSSIFRALSDSKATIHFTELTFTFVTLPLPDIDPLEEAWNSLDECLAHTAFSSVRSIHFKGIDWHWQSDPRAAYTVLPDRMRLVLPRLASRGVLRLD